MKDMKALIQHSCGLLASYAAGLLSGLWGNSAGDWGQLKSMAAIGIATFLFLFAMERQEKLVKALADGEMKR